MSELLQAPGEAEIGHVLRAESWGTGMGMSLASDAAPALVESARSTLGLTRVLVTCRPWNIGSMRVLEKSVLRQIDYLRGTSR